MSSSITDSAETSPTAIDASRRGAAIAWGGTAAAVSLVGVLPIIAFWILGPTADPDYGWLLFFTLPFSLLLGAIGVVLGIVGTVFARRAGNGYLWPVTGLVLGVAPIVFGVAYFSGTLS